MPARNSVKQFVSQSYYHLYNRGVEKRKIFLDEQDYGVFLSYLKTYLLPKDLQKLQSVLADPDAGWRKKDEATKILRMNNFADTLVLLSYCLMSNHFHLLVKQEKPDTIDQFMQSLGTRYSMYFNKKYRRVGSLFQDVYKAVLVQTDEQLLHLSRYIHRNPFKFLASQGDSLRSYAYSSYQEYLGHRRSEWMKTEDILAYFQSRDTGSLAAFVEARDADRHDITNGLLID